MTTATTLGLLSLLAGPAMPPSLPEGWRRPKAGEVAQPWRARSTTHFTTARADFDGDGKPDEAALLAAESGTACALVVMKGDAGAPVILERFDGVAAFGTLGVDVAKPGTYTSACGKGYFECGKDEPRTVVLKLPAIDLFREESARSFYVYDDGKRTFVRVWMSD